ncbi:MAG: hypothetical protein V4487_08545 [Chlamydiota bacterium]
MALPVRPRSASVEITVKSDEKRSSPPVRNLTDRIRSHDREVELDPGRFTVSGGDGGSMGQMMCMMCCLLALGMVGVGIGMGMLMKIHKKI